jgi:repressor LexA
MLTKAGERVLNEIIKYIKANQIAPSVRELTDLTGLRSTSNVHTHLNNLERDGYIKKHPTLPRTIIVLKGTEESVPMVQVPLEDLRKIRDLFNSLPMVAISPEDIDMLKDSLNVLEL